MTLVTPRTALYGNPATPGYEPNKQDLVTLLDWIIGRLGGSGLATRFEALMMSDGQPLYYDARMPAGQRLSQPAMHGALLARMRARFPNAQALFYLGDLVERPGVAQNHLDEWDTALPGHGFQIGDEYPAGFSLLLEQLKAAGWAIQRFFPNGGNHEFEFALYRNKRAWTNTRYQEVFGAHHYIATKGNLVWIFLSDMGGGSGGQLPKSALDWADDLMSQPAGPSQRYFHIHVHQPPIGFGPTPSLTVMPSVTATAGQTVVNIGTFTSGAANALEVFLGGVSGGTKLTLGTDYTINVTLDSDEQPVLPYTSITMTTPLTAGQIVQARRANVDASQDPETSARLLEMCEKHQGRLKAIFYGHRGNLFDAAAANVQTHPDFGTLFVNNNMHLPRMGLTGGLHPITNPLIYTHLEWVINEETGGGTLTGRRYNDTAGDWMENTHPAADHTFTIAYDFLDLGRIDEWHDSRKLVDGTPPGRNIFNHIRDISELREFSDADPLRPFPTDLIGSLIMGRIGLEDKHLSNVRKGTRLVIPVSVPKGSTSEINGRVAWVEGGPSREVLRLALEVEDEDDDANSMAVVIEARTPTSDDWREVFRVGGTASVNIERGVHYPLLALPTITDTQFTAGVRYLLLGRYDSEAFKLSGRLIGGRAETSSVHGNHAVFDIASHKGSDGGARATSFVMRHTVNVTNRRVAVKKVAFGGENWLALELSGASTVPAFRSGIYFSGWIAGHQPQWVNAADVSGVTDPFFDTLFHQVNGSEIFRQANILGAVAQAAGVPTGAVIERGSNANGEFVRFADGTQICWRVNCTCAFQTTASLTYDAGYPAAFVGQPALFPSLVSPYAYNGTAFTTGQLADGVTRPLARDPADPATRVVFNINRPASGLNWVSGDNLRAHYVAIGRWF